MEALQEKHAIGNLIDNTFGLFEQIRFKKMGSMKEVDNLNIIKEE